MSCWLCERGETLMYIIIVGGGSVGYHLCKALLKEGHEVLVLDKDAAKCENFEDEMGSVCVRGDGCEVATLAEAGVSRAEGFIAATGEGGEKLGACRGQDTRGGKISGQVGERAATAFRFYFDAANT